ncbi:hypothetical protein STCU_03131 [Strigomonas culicis]|uniref:Transmembrane protein 231 n=1 Tax=Strigomonas culicis TaxID=28005 RepID=S9USL4_9TRYP|nr:hypothetical protein STCU_03131 [Strigomonas culicis]|eukprot:EPY31893.1 hypothetical protein STCU_03131 [Strigomonas culicis]
MLFEVHYRRSYFARGMFSLLFLLVCLLSIVGLPFVIGWFMQNFWLENNYFYQKPTMLFTGRAVLRVSTVLGKEYLWTTSDSFNDRFLAGTEMEVLPFVSVNADVDEMNRTSMFTFVLSVPVTPVLQRVYSDANLTAPAAPLDAIQKVAFLPEFSFVIQHYLIHVNMTAAPLVVYRRPFDAAVDTSGDYGSSPVCAWTVADMVFHTTTRLTGQFSYTDDAQSPLEASMRQPADVYYLEKFARLYSRRRQSVVLRPYVEAAGGPEVLPQEEVTHGLWEDLDTLNAFTWRIQLRVADAFVPYVPSYREVLKWAWVQYFVIAYVIQWLLWKLRGMIVTQGLIDTTAVYFARKLD